MWQIFWSFQNLNKLVVIELGCQSHLHFLKECKNRSFGGTSCRDMMSAFMGHHMRANVHSESWYQNMNKYERGNWTSDYYYLKKKGNNSSLISFSITLHKTIASCKNSIN